VPRITGAAIANGVLVFTYLFNKNMSWDETADNFTARIILKVFHIHFLLAVSKYDESHYRSMRTALAQQFP
jgi:hypothetical protein